LVLMDVRMPVMDGFAATQAIKADPQLRDTIVVAVSASVFPDVVERMREQGCDDFLSKPVRIGELLAVVAKYLQLPLRAATVVVPAPRTVAAQLPAPLLKLLQSAIAVGDIEAMRVALQPLYQSSPELVALVTAIEHQLDHFDIDAVRDLLAAADATL
jgi:CheY-like chemotaxis protein